MFSTRIFLVLSVMFAGASASAAAQSLEKRHQIELQFGVWNQVNDSRTEIGPGTVATTVGSSGAFGGIAYGHWVQEHLAVRISIGGMAAGVDVEIDGPAVATETAVVSRLLFGMKYYIPASTYGSSARPFVGAGIGAFIGSQTATEVSSTIRVESRTATAIGGDLTAGVDVILSRRFLVSGAVGFNIMTDFDETIGGSKNYGGPMIALGLSLLLGGG